MLNIESDIKTNCIGSFHDARILRESPFFDGMENEQVQGLILCDSAYPLRRWLLTPFRAPGDRRQERFNVAHARERVVVENTIGILKKRWYIHHIDFKLSVGRSSRAILACAVLHNVAQDVGLSASDEKLEDQEIGADPEGDVGPDPEGDVGPDHEGDVCPLDARALRQRIAARHF